MKPVIVLLSVLFIASFCAAQDLGHFEEVTAGNLFGLGARQMAMGGTGIASSLDGSALYYNPAALARIHRIEFQVGLTHEKYNNESSQTLERHPDSLGLTPILSRAEIDQTKTHLGSLNLTIPVPTYRGSLVVAFGFHRIMSFDRPALLDILDRNDADQIVSTYERETESEGINLYTAGAGVELSPNVSAGLALNVYSGKRRITYDYRYEDETNAYRDGWLKQITEDYIGAAFKGGLLFRPNSKLAIGLTVETPVDWQIEKTWFEDSLSGYDDDISVTKLSGKVEYDLKRPFIIGTGIAYRMRKFTFTGDIEYADWSQMSYGDNPEMALKNDSLQLYYRDVFNIRMGIEYQIPKAGLSLRGGLAVLPLAADKGFYQRNSMTRPLLKNRILNDRVRLSLGMGWLIDRVILLDVAYVRGGHKLDYTAYNNIGAIRDDYYQRIFATVSYRY
ncbi:MAG: hypothetical protein GY841_10795 [FCB group bacterium]|nr:hypothetical protein [FCB group bacterium]